jgi:membrane protein DedA with SNARE-associated domain
MTIPPAGMGDWVRDVVTTAGYPGLAALILVENLFPPIPSEVILPLAGFYVGRGELAFGWAVLAATLGSLIGALVIYAAARRGGRPLLLRHERVLRIRETDLDRADRWFERYGAWLVLFGRLVPGARSLVSVPAGLSRMPPVRFALMTAAGSLAWNAALIGVGWALGSNYDEVSAIVGPLGTAVTVVLVIAGFGFGFRWYRHRSAVE